MSELSPVSRISAARQRLGISQVELARRLKLNKGYVSRIENGRVKNISLFIARRVAAALDTTVDALFPEDG